MFKVYNYKIFGNFLTLHDDMKRKTNKFCYICID